MTADRIYRKALPMEKVISELKRCRGTQFDPGLVDILLELIDSGTLNLDDIQKRSMAVNPNTDEVEA